MTCRQLGGACDEVFEAETFHEMTRLSKKHGQEMFQKADKAHLDAMNKMMGLMHNPSDMEKWMKDRESEFDQLPHIK